MTYAKSNAKHTLVFACCMCWTYSEVCSSSTSSSCLNCLIQLGCEIHACQLSGSHRLKPLKVLIDSACGSCCIPHNFEVEEEQPVETESRNNFTTVPRKKRKVKKKTDREYQSAETCFVRHESMMVEVIIKFSDLSSHMDKLDVTQGPAVIWVLLLAPGPVFSAR